MAKTILVVEDDADADAVTILGESLRRQGYTLSASAMVARLSSGREALRPISSSSIHPAPAQKPS